MEVCVRLYSVGWCQICTGLQTEGEGRAGMEVIRWLYSSHYSMEGCQMAMLVSLLYGGGGEVWEPEGNVYTRLTTTLWS